MLEFEQLQTTVLVLIALCGLIISIAGACAAVVKFWRYAHKDSETNTNRLNEHDTYLASDKRRIERIEERQDKMEEINMLQLEALVDLLGHEIDGNHTARLAETRDRITKQLIKIKTSTKGWHDG